MDPAFFFGSPCAPWSGQQRKANPYPHHRSHSSDDFASNRSKRRRAATMPRRGSAARGVLPSFRQTQQRDSRVRAARRDAAHLPQVVNAKKVQRLEIIVSHFRVQSRTAAGDHPLSDRRTGPLVSQATRRFGCSNRPRAHDRLAPVVQQSPTGTACRELRPPLT